MCYFKTEIQLQMPAWKLSVHFLQSGLHKFSTWRVNEVCPGFAWSSYRVFVMVRLLILGPLFFRLPGMDFPSVFQSQPFILCDTARGLPSIRVSHHGHRDSLRPPWKRGTSWRPFWMCLLCHSLSVQERSKGTSDSKFPTLLLLLCSPLRSQTHTGNLEIILNYFLCLSPYGPSVTKVCQFYLECLSHINFFTITGLSLRFFQVAPGWYFAS